MISLESIQSILADLTSFFQFAGALLGLCAIILPLLRTLPFYHSLIYWSDVCFTLFFHALSRISSLFYLPYTSSSYSSFEELAQDPLTICLASNSTAPVTTTLISGLSNTGNTCFLNSVLQAISSLPSLHQYLYTVRNPNSPVSSTLFKTIRRLSKPQQSRSSIRPSDLVQTLSTQQTQSSTTCSGFRRRSSFLTNRRQQDAQEFFQVLMDAVDTETSRQISTKEPQANKNDTGLITPRTSKPNNRTHDPLSGLLASQLSCVHCGYVGTIRHFSFNNIQLSLPNSYSATIESCLKQYTAKEYLRDATCRQCSLLTTSRMMAEKVGTLKRQAKHMQKNKDKKRQLLTEMVSLEKERVELEQRLRLNQIDSSDDDDENDTSRRKSSNRIGNHSKMKYHRTISPRSTKQVMIAKPPPSLCLHMTRSAMHQSSGMIFKNTCQLLFDEYLDLTPFVVHGTLDNHSLSTLSSFAESNKKPATRSSYLYRLMSVVVHYGGHSYGHYIAYKRRILPHNCRCHSCSKQNNHGSLDSSIQQKDTNKKAASNIMEDTGKDDNEGEIWDQCQSWYRISDSKVDPCTIDDILSSNPYMLFYERVDPASDEGKARSARYQPFDHRSSYTSYDDEQSDSYSDYNGNESTDDDSGDNDNDDDTSSDLHQPISPATPLDDDDGDFTPSYYSELTGTSLEALEMANALLNMDQQESS